MQLPFFNQLFTQAIKHKRIIITLFWFGYAVIFFMVLLGVFWVLNNTQFGLMKIMGDKAGDTAAVLFLVTISPGIAKRLAIKHKSLDLVMVFRRQFGLLMFSFAFLHYSYVRFLPIALGKYPIPQVVPTFELMGILTLYPMVVLAFTSNNLSVKHLGPWWKRIHSFVYIAVWLLFFHVMLNKIGILSLLLGVFAVLEVYSLYYAFQSKPRTVQP